MRMLRAFWQSRRKFVDLADKGVVPSTPNNDISQSALPALANAIATAGAITAALVQYGNVEITKPGTYYIGAPITITQSYRSLRLGPGVVLKQHPSMLDYMLKVGNWNQWTSAGRRLGTPKFTNASGSATIEGFWIGGEGEFQRSGVGGNGGPGPTSNGLWPGHTAWLQNFRNGTIEGLRWTGYDTQGRLYGGKWSIWANNFVDFFCNDPFFECPSDGVHVTGPYVGFFCSGCHGFTGDNMVAIVPGDDPTYDATYGHAKHSRIKNLRVGRPRYMPAPSTIEVATIGTGTSPTVTTSAPHGLANGQRIQIDSSGTTPALDGQELPVTVVTATTFTVTPGYNVTVGAATGSISVQTRKWHSGTGSITDISAHATQPVITIGAHSWLVGDEVTLSGTIIDGTYVILAVTATTIAVAANSGAGDPTDTGSAFRFIGPAGCVQPFRIDGHNGYWVSGTTYATDPTGAYPAVYEVDDVEVDGVSGDLHGGNSAAGTVWGGWAGTTAIPISNLRFKNFAVKGPVGSPVFELGGVLRSCSIENVDVDSDMMGVRVGSSQVRVSTSAYTINDITAATPPVCTTTAAHDIPSGATVIRNLSGLNCTPAFAGEYPCVYASATTFSIGAANHAITSSATGNAGTVTNYNQAWECSLRIREMRNRSAGRTASNAHLIQINGGYVRKLETTNCSLEFSEGSIYSASLLSLAASSTVAEWTGDNISMDASNTSVTSGKLLFTAAAAAGVLSSKLTNVSAKGLNTTFSSNTTSTTPRSKINIVNLSNHHGDIVTAVVVGRCDVMVGGVLDLVGKGPICTQSAASGCPTFRSTNQRTSVTLHQSDVPNEADAAVVQDFGVNDTGGSGAINLNRIARFCNRAGYGFMPRGGHMVKTNAQPIQTFTGVGTLALDVGTTISGTKYADGTADLGDESTATSEIFVPTTANEHEDRNANRDITVTAASTVVTFLNMTEGGIELSLEWYVDCVGQF